MLAVPTLLTRTSPRNARVGTSLLENHPRLLILLLSRDVDFGDTRR